MQERVTLPASAPPSYAPSPSAVLDIDVMRSIVAIAEQGSVSAAAERVARTPAALSMQLKKLEETLGVRLFARSRSGMQPTAEGERLLPHARRMLEAHRDAIAAFRAPALAGSVCVGMIDDVCAGQLSGVLAAFARSHPDVQVSVVSAPTEQLAPLLRADALDMAIITPGGSIDWQQEDRVVQVEQLVWAGQTGGCAQLQRPLPLAVAEEGCCWRRSTLAALERAGIPYRIAYQSNSYMGQLAAVEAGLAIAPVPRRQLTERLRAFCEADGLPPLGESRIVLRRAPWLTEAAARESARSGDGDAIPGVARRSPGTRDPGPAEALAGHILSAFA
ncbi:MAG: LysR family transcriptional regulator [Pseudomonadota bacterium]